MGVLDYIVLCVIYLGFFVFAIICFIVFTGTISVSV